MAGDPSFDSLLQDLASAHRKQEEQIATLRQENASLRKMLTGASPVRGASPVCSFHNDVVLEDWKRVDRPARTESEETEDETPKQNSKLSLLQCLPFHAGAALFDPAAALAARACGGVLPARWQAPTLPRMENRFDDEDASPKTNVSDGRRPSRVSFSTRSPSLVDIEINPRAHFCGVWVDPNRDFFGGCQIQIHNNAWKPSDPVGEENRNAIYAVGATSDWSWELVQKVEGSEANIFIAEPQEDKLLITCQKTGRKWTLERLFGATPSLSWGRQIPNLWPEWDAIPQANFLQRIDSGDEDGQLPVMRALIENQSRHVLARDAQTGQALLLHPRTWWALVVMKPSSIRRISWDLMSCCMICFDVFTVPLVVFDHTLFEDTSLKGLMDHEAKGLEAKGLMAVMSWVTIIFWTFDVPMSLCTGFHFNGIIELRPKPIWKNYTKTWAIFDMCILLPDWFFLLFPTAQIVGILRVTKGVRFVRILRAIRLLRFVRLQRFLHDVVEMINSETLRAFFTIALALGFIITINHYIACGWFFLGRIGTTNHMPNWLDENLSDERAGDGQHKDYYSYFTAVHWSLTQFTPASMEVCPRNIAERVYSICVLLFAMVSFSSFLASITAAITNLRHFATETSKEKHLLRRYFIENRVPNDLGNRIWSYLKKNHFKHKPMKKRDIQALNSLSSSLHKELCMALYLPYITRLPFMSSLLSVYAPLVTGICQIVQERSLNKEEEVFHKGSDATAMYVLVNGELDYHHSDRRFEETLTDAGDWVCEQVLWLQWKHCGHLVSKNFCDVLKLEASAFRATVGKCNSPLALTYVQMYARKFFEHFQAIKQNASDMWRTDLYMDDEELTGLAYSAQMDSEELQHPSPCSRAARSSSSIQAAKMSSTSTTRSKKPVVFDINFD